MGAERGRAGAWGQSWGAAGAPGIGELQTNFEPGSDVDRLVLTQVPSFKVVVSGDRWGLSGEKLNVIYFNVFVS